MIVTSNTVEHNFSIPNLTTVGQVDLNLDVIEQVTILIESSTTFDHTYTTVVYDNINNPGSSGITTIVTESKTVDKSCQYNVSLATAGITTFSAFDDLTEDEVLQWAFAADASTKATNQSANETSVLEKKDRILNPLLYKKDSPVTPWQRRADEASVSE